MKYASQFRVQPGWKMLIGDMGINISELLRLARLPEDLFARADASLTTAEYFGFWEALDSLTGEQELPLLIGQAISAEVFDPPIFAALCSPNLNTALQRLKQFKALIGPMTLHVDMGDRATDIRVDCYDYGGPIPRSLAATELVFFTQLVRLATRQHVVPLDAALRLPPESLDDYTTFLGVPIRQADYNGIRFAAADATRPFLTENRAMWESFEPGLKRRLADLELEASTAERVKSALLEMLPSGLSSMDEVASRLAMSKRTLQRRLTAEGTSFQQVLNSTRESLAQHYLAHSALASSEISFLLGFQDTNSFVRAFSSWTGMSPGSYRLSA